MLNEPWVILKCFIIPLHTIAYPVTVRTVIKWTLKHLLGNYVDKEGVQLAKCQLYNISLCSNGSNLVNEGVRGVKNPQNLVNVVYERALKESILNI